MTARQLTIAGAVFGGCLLMAVAATAHAGVDAKATLKCQQTVSKETNKFLQAKVKILQKCQESLIKDKVTDPGAGGRTTFCLGETQTADKIAKATSKLNAQIVKACCGKSKDCADTSDNCTLADVGVTSPVCPDSEGGNAPASSCKGIVMDDPGDLAACIACVTEEHADEAVTLLYEQRVDADPKSADKAEKALVKCQSTIGKETLKFLAAKSKALQKCWDERLKGKHTNPCPAPGNGKTLEAIAKAESKKVGAICKACGGAGKACESGIGDVAGDGLDDDTTAAAIGFLAECPNVVDGGASSGTVTSLEDLIVCVDQKIMDRVDCVSALSNPFEAVPAKCKPAPCQGTGSTVTVGVDFAAGSTTPAAVQTVLVYPENKVDLPGVADDASVSARVTVQQAGTVAQANDLNDALIENIVGILPFTGSDLYEVEFDECGATPTSGEFTCVVLDASDDAGNQLTDVTCSATVLP